MSRRNSSDTVDATVGIAEEHHVLDAHRLRCGALLVLADLRHVGPADAGIEASGVAIGHDAVHDVHPGVGPGRHGAGHAEVDIIGMGGHHQQRTVGYG